jgi:uncharacterized protein YdbL (DUF1318 family)
MQRLGQCLVLLCVVGLTVTCAHITVNIYFPAAEIRDAAAKIEQEVRHPDAPSAASPPKTAPPSEKKPQSQQGWPPVGRGRLALSIPSAIAQDININITTPAIRQIIAARQQRFSTLVPFFDNGALGENNRGLIETRDIDQLSLQDRGRVKTLLQQENSDRQQLYRSLADANNIAQDRVADIAAIFAGVNRQEARPGWWIQQANGAWEKKR